MFSGILNVRRGKGFASHDIVVKLRGILHQKKVGHTGTLDPAAEDVLPVYLGSATKLVESPTGRARIYRAVFLLGVEADSQDMTGTALRTQKMCCSEEKLRAAVQSFVGGYEQVLPMCPAKKQGGKKLTDLAYRGIMVERPTQRVEISDIRLEEITLSYTMMTADCGKEAYTCTFCHDIDEKLGCGGVMEALLRTRVGSFRLEGVYTLSEPEVAVQAGEIGDKFVSIEDCLALHPARKVLPGTDAKLENDDMVVKTVIENGVNENGTLIHLYLSDRSSVGLFQRKDRQYWTEKIFLE